MDLKPIPTDVLNRAVSEAPEGYPVQFVCRADNSVILARMDEIKAEIAVRKLNEEVNRSVKYYDKSYIDHLKARTAFTSNTSSFHAYSTFSSNILDKRLNDSMPQHILEHIGNRTVDVGRPHETFLDKVYKFFDKFSIKFTTGVTDERVEQPSKDSDASDICEKR